MMSNDIKKLLKNQRQSIFEEKKRLGVLKQPVAPTAQENEHPSSTQTGKYTGAAVAYENHENVPPNRDDFRHSAKKQSSSLVERLDLSSIEKDKQLFIDKLINSENPLSIRSDDRPHSAMFRYGEYSPNKPQSRVTTAPYLGLGEYEQRKHFLQQQLKDEYQQHIEKSNEKVLNRARNVALETYPIVKKQTKAVQTDIQNIHVQLVSLDGNHKIA